MANPALSRREMTNTSPTIMLLDTDCATLSPLSHYHPGPEWHRCEISYSSTVPAAWPLPIAGKQYITYFSEDQLEEG